MKDSRHHMGNAAPADALTTHLRNSAHEFLEDLEQRFGPTKCALRSVRIDPVSRAPHPLFSGFRLQFADIILTKRGWSAANWELAHECVHLLDPWSPCAEGRSTNVLEEGLATWYQNYKVKGGGQPCPPYAQAEALVKPHIDELVPAVKLIRTQRHWRLGEVPAPILSEYCPSLPANKASALCREFGLAE